MCIRDSDLDFSACKILLGDAVLLVEEDHGVQLDSFLHFLVLNSIGTNEDIQFLCLDAVAQLPLALLSAQMGHCLLYTSDAADEEDSGDLGGRGTIKKKKES